jgi:formyl-CoA transferase
MTDGALAGLRVVDLSRVLGGPYATQILADHGAEVIKIEPPQGDETRDYGPPFGPEYSAYFAGVNRNKTVIALDLASEGGREVLLRLLEDADVLVENFRRGTMERWNLGYEAVLKARFPALVYCRISGFGDDGPLGGYPGYDAMVQSWSGLHSVNGTPESGPIRLGIPIVDLSTGLNAVIGILTALQERHRSGLGQMVGIALFDCGVSLLHPHAANWFMSGRPPRRMGNSHGSIAPYDLFETATRAMLIGAGNDKQFQRLCAELDLPELAADPRFRTNNDRVANRPAMCEAIARRLRDEDGEAIAHRLMKAGVPAGVVQEAPDVFNHPHTQHRKMVVEAGDYRGTGLPVKLSRTPGSVHTPPKPFGADNRAVLGRLGYTPEEIERLIETGVVPDRRATQ